MAPIQPEDPRRNHVLIVEGDLRQQEILKSALAGHGYEVEVASDGLDAVRKMREGHYDLALIGYDLPEIDGLATAKLVHDLMGETARPALLALTRWPDLLTTRQEFSGSAFDGVIAKPIRFPDLVSIIECYLNSAPNKAAHRGAEDDLLIKNWGEYDANTSQPSVRNGQGAPPYILIVEEDFRQRRVLRSALEANGYMVETASDGVQAVHMIHTGSFDLVLMSYLLPGLDGLAAARLILDIMSESVRPQMIALTAVPGQLNHRQEDSGSVFDEVVAKSSGLPALLATVARHLHFSPRRATRLAAEALESLEGKVAAP
jgi:two-component system sensor histidine kinase/response regulator